MNIALGKANIYLIDICILHTYNVRIYFIAYYELIRYFSEMGALILSNLFTLLINKKYTVYILFKQTQYPFNVL